MKDKILEAVQISKTYGEGESAVHALRNSDLTLENGTFASIIGSSGSGAAGTGAAAKDRLYFSGFPPVPGVHGAG